MAGEGCRTQGCRAWNLGSGFHHITAWLLQFSFLWLTQLEIKSNIFRTAQLGYIHKEVFPHYSDFAQTSLATGTRYSLQSNHSMVLPPPW